MLVSSAMPIHPPAPGADHDDTPSEFPDYSGTAHAWAAWAESLTPEEAAGRLFALLQRPEHVSEIAQWMIASGFAQRNLVFRGAAGTDGDQVVLCRWQKAASGAAIIATRQGAQGELEILFGRKQVTALAYPFWALPGGHHELDDHETLEHTLVAELMEETGIIPLADEFLSYIHATLQKNAGYLPYHSLADAQEHFIARDIAWDLVTVVSGDEAHWEKRSVNVAYRVHFVDGAHLRPHGSDDMGELAWFPLSHILMQDPDPEESFNPHRVCLNRLRYGQGRMIEAALRKIHAWTLCKTLVRSGSMEDFDFYMQYLKRLQNFSHTIEDIYGLQHGAVLRNCLVGPKHGEYIARAMALHKLRPLMEKELHRLKSAGTSSALGLAIERELLVPFGELGDGAGSR